MTTDSLSAFHLACKLAKRELTTDELRSIDNAAQVLGEIVNNLFSFQRMTQEEMTKRNGALELLAALRHINNF